jgi:hypothetical protein
MSELRKSLRSYLALRRALGFKLESQGRLLHRFVDFAEEQGESFITRDFALRFALASPHGQPALCAKRLQIVITPSTKLVTLFNWRHIGHGVHKNSSSPPWAWPA